MVSLTGGDDVTDRGSVVMVLLFTFSFYNCFYNCFYCFCLKL